jgi:PhzF family phenazine biosynthesis protein
VKPYKFALVDVFTEQPFAGNQLAVFPSAQGLTDDQMQAIAREFNYSETTFIPFLHRQRFLARGIMPLAPGGCWAPKAQLA